MLLELELLHFGDGELNFLSRSRKYSRENDMASLLFAKYVLDDKVVLFGAKGDARQTHKVPVGLYS